MTTDSSPLLVQLQPGASFAGWQVQSRLASGGGGEVWLATALAVSDHRASTSDADDSRFGVVIKVARAATAAALWREWNALLTLPVAQLPRAIWPVVHGPQQLSALIMQRVAGQSLHLALAGADAAAVVTFLDQALLTLSSLHGAGWVHGDLHGGNLLAADLDAGDLATIALLDLGLADRVGAAIEGPGLIATSAPERLRGENADPRDDLFSLANSAWQAWTGTPPWPDYPATLPTIGAKPVWPELAPAAPPELIALLGDMLSARREHRPQSALAALSRLHRSTGRPHPEMAQRLANDLVAVTQRPTLWRGEPLAMAGASALIAKQIWTATDGGGKSAALRTLQAQASVQGRASAWLQPTGDGAQLRWGGQVAQWQPPADSSPTFLGDAEVDRAVAAASWLADQLAQWAAHGLVLVDDADRLPTSLRRAIVQWGAQWLPTSMWQMVACGRSDWAPGSQAMALPTLAEPELAQWLGAATAGLRWDGAVVAALVAKIGACRSQAGLVAAELLLTGAVVVAGDQAQLVGSSATAAIELAALAASGKLSEPAHVPSSDLYESSYSTITELARAIAACVPHADAAAIVALCGRNRQLIAPSEVGLAAVAGAAPVYAAWLGALSSLGRLGEATEVANSLPAGTERNLSIALALADLHFRAGRYPQCRHICDEFLLHTDNSNILIWLAFAATWQGDRTAAGVAIARAELAFVGQSRDDAGPCWIRYLRGLDAYYAGRVAEAGEEFAQLIKIAGGSLRAAVLSGLGLVAHRRGDLAGARSWYAQAEAFSQAIGDRARALNMAMNVSVVDHEAGELGAALSGYTRVEKGATEQDNAGAVARARTNRGNLLSILGFDEAAQRDLRHALQFWQQSGNAHLEGNVCCILGEIARRNGDLQAAADQLAAADAALQRAGAATERDEILLERGHICLLQGHVVEAEQFAAQVRAQAAAQGHRELHGRALALQAAIALDADPFAAPTADQAAKALADAQLALELVPPTKLLHRCACVALRVRAMVLVGRLTEAKLLAVDALALLARTAASLPQEQRHGFAQSAAWRDIRLVLRVVGDANWPVASGQSSAAHSTLLQSVLAINRRLGSQRELAPLLEAVMDATIMLSGAERGFLLIDDGDPSDSAELRSERLRVAVARNLDRENLRRPQHKLSHTVAEQVFSNGDAVLTTDAQVDSRFAEQASVHAGSLRSILCVPLPAPEGILGAVYVDNRFIAGAFTPEHAALVAALADQAAIAIQTARLVARQRQTAVDLESSRTQVEQLNQQLRQQLAEVATQLDDARADLQAQRLAIARRSDYSQIRGESPQMHRLFSLMDRVRDHEFPVLVQGESGTGKELVARAIHFTGKRGKGPFVAVNCGALPSNLLESELFGHTKGAFTGAVAERRGLFEAADGGTLLLDEVGEMPLEMQVKLLRVLQTSEITRIGESIARKVDTRVVAATHRDLQGLVDKGKFREDLLYRLRVVELSMPSLRSRPADIANLVEHFVVMNRQSGIGDVLTVSRPALAHLCQAPWPGNVRQLEALLKSACLFATGTVLELADIEPLLSRERTSGPPSGERRALGESSLDDVTLDDANAQLVARRVRMMGGNKRKAAESLSIDRGTLYRYLRQIGAHSRKED
ncbi:MAG: GAF domain-containing protein [Myxococcales bacterium]|nr:GAF domain-containing protein [Myxococcales bacterium]